MTRLQMKAGSSGINAESEVPPFCSSLLHNIA
uniref:Uncharacterized protein n=1 Tax=Anguilla anguilla TaxID=7936 RepID=A0A0E9W1F8_ANGAN